MSCPPVCSTSRNSDFDGERQTFCDQAKAKESVTTISTATTASNLPGAGRLVGRVYSYLGRHVENVLNRLAERLGFGPVAIKEYCMSICNDGLPALDSKQHKVVKKKLEWLIRYAESEENRGPACEVIIYIAVDRPYFYSTLRSLNAEERLKLVDFCERRVRRRCHCLLSPSRLALMSVTKGGLNAAGKEWISLHRAAGNYLLPGGLQLDVVALPLMSILMEYMRDRCPEEAYIDILQPTLRFKMQ